MTGSSSKPAAAGPRSVALVGPYGSGKSTLFDALLAAAGAPLKRSSDPRGRTMSSELRLGHCTYLGDRWSILDCPGSVEFSFETAAALTAVDLAVVVCEPAADRASTLPVILRTLEESGLPHFIFVNKIDTLAGSVDDMLAALQTHSKRPLLLRQIPIREGDSVIGFVDVVAGRAYRYRPKQSSELIELPSEMREPEKEALAGLTETLADHDDALMEQLLEDVAPTSAEIYQHLRKDQASAAIVEVLFGAAAHGHGIARLWKALRHDAPDSRVAAERRGVAAGDQPLAQIFKTVHAGKLAYGRVWRGVLRDGASFNGARVGGVSRFIGGEAVRTPEAEPKPASWSRSGGSKGSRRGPFSGQSAPLRACPSPRRRRRSMRWP